MKLSEYPRPPADTGRGIHWSPSQYQWGRHEWPKWEKRILELGLKWVKVNVPPDYNAEAIAKRLIDIEVMPVCRFIRKNPTRLTGSVQKSIERLIELGVRYFETNNEPDADVEWEGYKRPSGWEEIVIKNLIYDAHMIHDMGGCPAFVAFNCGPTESRNPIQILVDQPDGREIFDKGLWVSLHNYGKGRPFNYPNDRVRMFGDPVTEEEWLDQGQPDFWTDQETIEFVWHNMTREQVNRRRQEQKDPHITIMTDITCFRAYEYWNQLITQEGLDPIPIMMTEGGWETGDRVDDFYPEPTAQRASDLNFKMFQFIQGSTEMTISKPDGSTQSSPVPDYLFTVMPWHMGEKEFGLDTSGQWEQGAWFTHWYDKKFGLNGELPIIQMLRDLPTRIRANGPVPPEWNLRKTIESEGVEEWDYRFKYLGEGIRVKRAETTGLKWKIVGGLWQDKNEVNPKQPIAGSYIMAKVLAENGDPIPEAKVEIDRGDAVDTILTKGAIDQFLGNYRMSGTLGTYTVRVTHEGYPSDSVYNVGLGREEPGAPFDPTGFLFIFQLTDVSKEPAPVTEPTAQPTVETTAPPTIETEPPVTVEAPSTPVVETPSPGLETPTPPVVETPPPTTTAPEPEITAEPQEPAVNEAEHLGVKILPIADQPFCTVAKIHHYTPEENMARSTLFLDVLNRQGKRAFGAVVLVKDSANQTLRVVIEKPESEPGGNTPMWPNNTYTIAGVEIEGKLVAAETVTGLRAMIPDKGDGHSFLVVLQLH